MVVRQDYASRSKIMDGAQTLSEGQLPILGCVLNGMRQTVGSGYGYGYEYGYGYGYGYGEKKK
jgi:Mrp family chromosome partitioning ATPase